MLEKRVFYTSGFSPMILHIYKKHIYLFHFYYGDFREKEKSGKNQGRIKNGFAPRLAQ